MADRVIPVVSSIEDVYPVDAISSQRERWNNLLSAFQKQYGRKANFVSRSPGRVNIIGEHIDYSLYECVPMAITADVLLAVLPSASSAGRKITIANVDPTTYPTRTFSIPEEGTDLEVDASAHDWSNYFKAGLRGAYDLLKRTKGDRFRSVGMEVLVDGKVPAGGGLSSSAAFVCAASLSAVRANGIHEVAGRELVECAIVSERLVGVNSGGMDQSACVLSLPSSANLISFHPSLNTTPITIPTSLPNPASDTGSSPDSTLSFLIAQSHVTSNKAETGPIHYNLRVVECTLAALVFARLLGLTESQFPPSQKDASPLGISLRGLHEAWTVHHGKSVPDPASSLQAAVTYRSQLAEMESLARRHLLKDEGYTREEIAGQLGITVAELEKRYMSAVPVRAKQFKLRQRAIHVFSEAGRVQEFVKLLRLHEMEQSGAEIEKQDGQTGENDRSIFEKLGALVSKTQESCRGLYECSCEELDSLCELAIGQGAYGARLTGAGWGGCVVCLCPEEKVERVKEAWRKGFYAKRWPNMGRREVDESVVVSTPGRGSVVVDVQGKDRL